MVQAILEQFGIVVICVAAANVSLEYRQEWWILMEVLSL